MPSPQLATTARCLRCKWTETGDPAKTDKAADGHTAIGHPTVTETRPVL